MAGTFLAAIQDYRLNRGLPELTEEELAVILTIVNHR
jgi:hypothetical protein